MVTYELEESHPCELCTHCHNCGNRLVGEIYHVLKNGGEQETMCVGCLREKGLLW
jgi:hypothetical protein